MPTHTGKNLCWLKPMRKNYIFLLGFIWILLFSNPEWWRFSFWIWDLEECCSLLKLLLLLKYDLLAERDLTTPTVMNIEGCKGRLFQYCFVHFFLHFWLFSGKVQSNQKERGLFLPCCLFEIRFLFPKWIGEKYFSKEKVAGFAKFEKITLDLNFVYKIC